MNWLQLDVGEIRFDYEINELIWAFGDWFFHKFICVLHRKSSLQANTEINFVPKNIELQITKYFCILVLFSTNKMFAIIITIIIFICAYLLSGIRLYVCTRMINILICISQLNTMAHMLIWRFLYPLFCERAQFNEMLCTF